MTFNEIMLASSTRSDIIASFVAILEMLKSQRIIITADSDIDNIYFEINVDKTETEGGGNDVE